MRVTIQLRRGTKEACERCNEVLRDGEPVFEIDTGKVKVGDGKRAYSELPYMGIFVEGKRCDIQLSD